VQNTNVDNAVEAISISKRVSSKGSNYYMLVLTLVNGSETEVFVDASFAGLLTYIADNEKPNKTT